MIVIAPATSFVILGSLGQGVGIWSKVAELPGYLSDTFVHHDLGYSGKYRKPMFDVLLAGLPVDVELLVGGLAVGVTVGAATGLACGRRRGRPLDRALGVGSAFALSVPIYWFGFAVLTLFAPRTGYLVQVPFLSWYGGYVPVGQDPARWLQALWLPWAILALPLAAMCQRMVRASVVDLLHEDFVRTARAKGLRDALVMRRHALRAALPPVLSLVSANMALMVTNVILVETAFRLPGFLHEADIGQFLGENGHIPGPDVVQALVLEAAALISVSMFVADLLHAQLDPRARALS